MFRKVLIANRGEIAVRVAQTLQQMGIVAAAVYSEADRGAVHVRAADEAYPLEGSSSAETYLRGDKIIEIARRCGAEAIHPGYGFLSENADFAQSCADAGFTFIGPTPPVIRAMGDKIVAKKTFADAGVPVVPGATLESGTFDEAKKCAKKIGYPVLIKAAAGGGGKGMRVVQKESDLAAAIEAAQREAGAAFGDGRVFLEKYLTKPRHVEFQIFGDTHGNVVHLFERECSIQRRHQKIIEESPSPALTPELRAQMGDAAVRAAQAIGYTNAGTVEFILDESGEFYFLEVNTRLQVEHPVTEMTLGRDLVRAQILVAAGQPLLFSQDDLRQDGHAIECRIYAEDAARGFLPSIGTILRYVAPIGGGLRIDSGVGEGSQISVHYDPMLAKLIAHGRTRREALDKMLWALDRYVILGITTNIDLLRAVIAHPEFAAGRLHTHFLETHDVLSSAPSVRPDAALIIAALAAQNGRVGPATHRDSVTRPSSGPWRAVGAWRAY
ncbi:MAG TPA: acetyl-CoA carboxylase biotin carboxylase subunit [Phycisphaerae bacterium]|nr:acetyl-CoA carboxylase biotin carboxylase subunit [Phycisphaerae bacterium]